MPPASRRLRVVEVEMRSWGERTETYTGRPRNPVSLNVPAVKVSWPMFTSLFPSLSGIAAAAAPGEASVDPSTV